MNEPNNIAGLRLALEKSVALQSHYAALLNQYDGGKRVSFPTAAAWLARLVELDKTQFPDGGKITMEQFEQMQWLLHIVVLDEGERQMVIRALAIAALKSPGFDYALAVIALKMDNTQPDGRPAMYEQFKKYNAGREVEIAKLLTAAGHALRSYQCGNGSTELAAEIADKIAAAGYLTKNPATRPGEI